MRRFGEDFMPRGLRSCDNLFAPPLRKLVRVGEGLGARGSAGARPGEAAGVEVRWEAAMRRRVSSSS